MINSMFDMFNSVVFTWAESYFVVFVPLETPKKGGSNELVLLEIPVRGASISTELV